MNYLLKILDYILPFIPNRVISRGSTHVEKPTVLLVRLDHLGDFIIWARTAKYYRELYPTKYYTLVLVANAAWAELAREMSYWDQVVSVDYDLLLHSPLYKLAVIGEIRRTQPQIAINPARSREFHAQDILVKTSGAPEQIGIHGDYQNMSMLERIPGDRCYTRLIQPHLNVHEIDLNTEILMLLGLAEDSLDLSLEDIGKPDLELPSRPFFVVAPGAGHKLKRVSAALFAKLIEAAVRETGLLPIITGTSAECELTRQIKASTSLETCDMTGSLSLRELYKIVHHAQFVVSNDSGVYHLAAALERPTFGIVGGGHFGRFLPYPTRFKNLSVHWHAMTCFGCNWRCIYPEKKAGYPCITRISPESAMADLALFLKHLPDGS